MAQYHKINLRNNHTAIVFVQKNLYYYTTDKIEA
jgi:hypothetical protein